MAKPIYINERLNFPTKKAGEAWFNARKDEVAHGERITNPDLIHALLWLVQQGSDPDRKVGCGVDYFTVFGSPDDQPGTAYYLVRTDGSKDAIGMRKFFHPKTRAGNVTNALRLAVKSQRDAAIDAAFASGEEVRCHITDVVLRRGNTHADHHPVPFADLVDRWMAEEGLAIDSIVFAPPRDGVRGKEMGDPHQLASWQKFHGEHATLKMSLPKANAEGGIAIRRQRKAASAEKEN